MSCDETEKQVSSLLTGRSFEGTNAKEELFKALKQCGKTLADIKILYIVLERTSCEDIIVESVSELDKLDSFYDDGYGSQCLFGYVLFHDNSWLERYEYDGSEMWVYKDYREVERKIRNKQVNIF